MQPFGDGANILWKVVEYGLWSIPYATRKTLVNEIDDGSQSQYEKATVVNGYMTEYVQYGQDDVESVQDGVFHSEALGEITR